VRRGGLPVLILGLAGCATQPQAPPPVPDDIGLLERVRILELRVADLEGRLPPQARTYPAPRPGSAGGVSSSPELDHLRSMRRELLDKYTARHPDVLLLDREIRRIELGLPPDTTPLRPIPEGVPLL
jgi:hypothetical protein